ncbi:MAG: hypothetical protein ACRCVA_01215 [Phreatobacter sp.]
MAVVIRLRSAIRYSFTPGPTRKSESAWASRAENPFEGVLAEAVHVLEQPVEQRATMRRHRMVAVPQQLRLIGLDLPSDDGPPEGGPDPTCRMKAAFIQ